jgi:N4-gp56 family major capsid protein
MADFTTNLSGTVEIDNSDVTEEIVSEFIIQYNQTNVMDPYADYVRDIDAKSISFPRYTLTSPATTALNEREDVTSTAMADSAVTLTPAEYGMAITPTKLVDLQTGGRVLRAAVQLAAINMAETRNTLAIQALEASSNTVSRAGENLDGDDLNLMYNKLARANVPKHPVTGTYVAFMHDDVIHDLRAASSAGSWEDVNKYTSSFEVMNNEVGMYKGFRIIRNNHCETGVAGSPGDGYTSSFIGFNALGLAESAVPSVTITGPFDKLGRFVNIGWYGVFQYKIIETDSVWTVTSTSSLAA